MNYKLSFLAFMLGTSTLLNAQVGIGTVVPDTNAILDLTNTSQKGLKLPSAPGLMPASPYGLMYFTNSLGKIQYLETGGYNTLSPWKYKFNGSSSEDTYYEESGNVGIGLSAPQRKLHIKGDGIILALEGTSSANINFYPQSFSAGSKAVLGFESSSSTTFKIRNTYSGGSVEVNVNNGGNFNVANGRIQEYGNTLIPPGVIIIWYGSVSTIPAGWALCDGQPKTKLDGGTIQAPDLRDRFVMGAGGTTSQGDTGGEKETEITVNNIPAHTHSFSGSTSYGGGHRHTIYWSDQSSGGSPTGDMLWFENDGVSADGYVYTNNGSDDGSHTHSFSGTTDNSGNATPDKLENRPPFYALCYIIKL